MRDSWKKLEKLTHLHKQNLNFDRFAETTTIICCERPTSSLTLSFLQRVLSTQATRHAHKTAIQKQFNAVQTQVDPQEYYGFMRVQCI